MVVCAGSGHVESSAMPFPQAWSLSGALQEAQLQLLGKVMGVCAPAEQVRMLDGLRASATGKAGKQRERSDNQQQQAVVARACIAALSGLQTLVDRYKGVHISAQVILCNGSLAKRVRIRCTDANSPNLWPIRYALPFP